MDNSTCSRCNVINIKCEYGKWIRWEVYKEDDNFYYIEYRDKISLVDKVLCNDKGDTGLWADDIVINIGRKSDDMGGVENNSRCKGGICGGCIYKGRDYICKVKGIDIRDMEYSDCWFRMM